MNTQFYILRIHQDTNKIEQVANESLVDSVPLSCGGLKQGSSIDFLKPTPLCIHHTINVKIK